MQPSLLLKHSYTYLSIKTKSLQINRVKCNINKHVIKEYELEQGSLRPIKKILTPS